MLLLKPVVFNCTQTWGCRRTTGFSPQLCCIELTSLCFTLNSTSRPLILLDQFHYESSKCAVWVCVLQCFTSSFSTTLSPTSLPPTFLFFPRYLLFPSLPCVSISLTLSISLLSLNFSLSRLPPLSLSLWPLWSLLSLTGPSLSGFLPLLCFWFNLSITRVSFNLP